MEKFLMYSRSAVLLTSLLLGACQIQGSAEVEDASATRGEHVFTQHCSTCHGDTGAGQPPWFPSLQRIAALREPSDMVETVMNGRFRRGGELNGHTIPIMPAWGQLSDEDVTAVINYVQQNWGEGRSITTEEVTSIRAKR
jgi:mono/diheme cytochrome c family protein